ncbi:hypothetical protein MKW94_006589, partial [Papaver nudicaule]|nr:hypothetical protein [Papaver nudicaule]
ILELAKVPPTCFPTFENLIHLEVYYICYLQMNTLLNFLDFSPNLESLVIGKVELSWHRDEKALTFNIVPRCLECLKSIEIQKFNGRPWEMKVVEFVLKHARFLQTVILETSYTEENYIDPRARHTRKNLIPEKVEALNKQILMQLGMSPWASTGCVIKFSSS